MVQRVTKKSDTSAVTKNAYMQYGVCVYVTHTHTHIHIYMQWASLLAQVKNILQTKTPPAVREIWVPPLDWDDPLEKGMATHSSILA